MREVGSEGLLERRRRHHQVVHADDLLLLGLLFLSDGRLSALEHVLLLALQLGGAVVLRLVGVLLRLVARELVVRGRELLLEQRDTARRHQLLDTGHLCVARVADELERHRLVDDVELGLRLEVVDRGAVRLVPGVGALVGVSAEGRHLVGRARNRAVLTEELRHRDVRVKPNRLDLPATECGDGFDERSLRRPDVEYRPSVRQGLCDRVSDGLLRLAEARDRRRDVVVEVAAVLLVLAREPGRARDVDDRLEPLACVRLAPASGRIGEERGETTPVTAQILGRYLFSRGPDFGCWFVSAALYARLTPRSDVSSPGSHPGIGSPVSSALLILEAVSSLV